MEMADLFLDRKDPQQLAKSVDFLVKHLELGPGDRVFDQCCGVGTVSFALAKQGVAAIGVDLCSAYIEAAQKEDAESFDCEFHCEDAFVYRTETPCDGAFNWYSSYGYADSEQQNHQMLRRAFESIKPGRRYALDVPHFAGVMRQFQFHLVRHGVSQGRQVTCIRESQIDWESGQLKQNWQWLVEGSTVDQRQSALRLYWPHQIREGLQEVGFTDVEMFGGTDGSALTLDSPRLILVARKPK